jgi:hypothetical protein
MAKEEYNERFDRAVVTLGAVIAQTTRMNAGYEDSLVAGVMDFLHGWFSSEIYRTIDWAVPGPYEHEFSRDYKFFVPSTMIALLPITIFSISALLWRAFATRSLESPGF